MAKKKSVNDGELTNEAVNAYLETMDAIELMKKHVTKIVKKRNFTIDGDESHLSVSSILKQARDIDQPRKYDFQSKKVHEEDFLRSLTYLLPDLFSLVRPGDVKAAIAGQKPLVIGASRDYKCYDCAQPLMLTVSGNHLHISGAQPCEKNEIFSIEIDFPTGEIVYADWPDRFSEIRAEGYIDEGEDESINYLRGQRKRSEAYARQGIFHLSVGNSCPSWYYNEATGEILIGGGTYDEDTDETTHPEGFKQMGSFCTDLWWTTMLDKSLYDEMISKLPAERDETYYDKDVEVATIKPGRYRFTSAPCSREDDYEPGRVFATAQYIGPCGEIPKVRNMLDTKVLLTPRQMVIQSSTRYPELYEGQFEQVRFGVMDHIFNVLGNGIKTKGDFLAHISVPQGTEISDELPKESSKKAKHEDRSPYPGFNKKYSLLWGSLDYFPVEWLEEAIWFYTKCREFFFSDKVSQYHSAYPSSKRYGGLTVESMTETLKRYRKEGQSEEEFHAQITKDYECEFDGDVEAFLLRRWAKEKTKIITFIDQTVARLKKELKSRKA